MDRKIKSGSVILIMTFMVLLAGCTDRGAQVRDGDDEKTYNLLEDAVEFEMVSQLSGTCWLCASSCAMSTGNQLNHGGNIVLDQYELLDEIYSDDKDEGVFLATGVDKKKFGGLAISVVNQLSRGFGDGLVLDDSIDANEWTDDEIKMGIREYGALYVGVPDSKMGRYDGFMTMNYPDAEPGEFDHSIAVIGWDDDFPKENFMTEASGDGAWITYNSNYPGEYYYVSYDTPFDRLYDTPCFMSVTDEYSQVLSYDCGHWMTDPVITGDETTTANFFTGKGKLAAIGTYVLEDDSDLTIQIMTPDLKECLYSQKCHSDHKGYHVFKLDTPMEVRAYAVAVTYPTGAPVEGESMVYDSTARVDVVSEKGQSYILVGDEWLDMSEQTTWDKVGCVTNNACIRALYTGDVSVKETSTDSADTKGYSADDAIYQQFLGDELKLDGETFSEIFSFVKEDFDTDPVTFYYDVDEDGKDELLVTTVFYGYNIYDVRNGELELRDCGDGTAAECGVYKGNGHVYVSHSDFSHAGRKMLSLVRYDGDGVILETIDINAEYWDAEDDMYDENSDFTYNGKKITMQEYEDYMNSYEFIDPDSEDARPAP